MGFFYKEPIFVHVVNGGKTQNIDFSTSMFDYGHNKFSVRCRLISASPAFASTTS